MRMLFTDLHVAGTSGAATAKGLLASSKHSRDLSPQHPNVPKIPSGQLARLRYRSSKFPCLAWLLTAAGRGSPAPASNTCTHIIKLSLTGVGKNEFKRKAVSQLSRWYESGSVTHLPARACWGVSEWNLIARHCALPARELSLGLPASAKPHLFPLQIKAVGAGAMPARAAHACRSEASSKLHATHRQVRSSLPQAHSNLPQAHRVSTGHLSHR